MTVETEKNIRAEFTRQAEPMASAPAFHAESAIRRLVAAVGESPLDRVLDVACGPGIVAEAIAPHVREVVGIDVTPKMVRLAHARFSKARSNNGQFQVASAENLPFPSASFDQIVTRLSFHHFADLSKVLAEVRRVLRPDGRFIIADVVSSAEPEEAALHNALERLRDPTHVRMRAPNELLEVIDRAGFAVVRQQVWEQPRSFVEWAAIVADPERTQALEKVMRALARAGQSAGISLREGGDDLRFTHTWMLVEARLS